MVQVPNLHDKNLKLQDDFHESRRMELKFGVATILCKYFDLTTFDKNQKSGGVTFIFC